MRLSISNLAWDIAEDASVAAMLQTAAVDAIDVAPGKYFPVLADAGTDEIAAVKSWWSGHGVDIIGMQALLFGTTGLNVFGNASVQDAMLRHLTAVCRIGAGLGATKVVFGSPKNRDRSGLSDAEAMDLALGFFGRLGDIAANHGVMICLEPNPPRYGANFMTTCAETASLVRQLAHPAVRMQFDTGALTINGEDPAAVLAENGALIGHVHISEPGLLPIGDCATEHANMAAAIAQYLPSHPATIEMLATQGEPHEASIARALSVAVQYYGRAVGGQP